MIIAAQNFFDGAAFRGPVTLDIQNGRIAALGPPDAPSDLTLPAGCLSPGLIDLHNNGAFGVDCATATPAEWDHLITSLQAHGVTALLPTVITAPMADLHRAAAGILAAMARHPAILGLHLEGPFLSPEKPGAHRPDWLQTPSPAALDALLASPALRAALRLITLAPELPHATAAIARLVAAGHLVALGHTAATAEQMQAGAAAGARLVTHVFTAQSPLHQRAPGAPAVALTDTRLHPCIIADGLHVDPLVLQLAFAACPRLVAVTDSIPLAGLAQGAESMFGGLPVRLESGIGRRPDGTIAGAAITLDEAVRRLMAAGIAPAIALAAATSRPADALGLPTHGRIAPGARADLVFWDPDWQVREVFTAGTPVLRSPPASPTSPITTEHPRDDLHDLETRPMADIVALFLAQEAAAQRAITPAAPALARLIEATATKLSTGGRLFYAGAGTSGRLALLDAVECGPTFGAPPGLIVPLLAGGDQAFLHAVEGAEDDTAAAITALTTAKFGPADVLVGIAASGATPFTLAALRHAAAAGALTGAIVNNPASPLAAAADIAVELLTGAEIIAGSTRLSAGTAQKIALNILSSGVMIRLGKTYGPFMVDLRATNEKLRRRARAIAQRLGHADAAAADHALDAANLHVKTAVVMLRLNLTPNAAGDRLAAAGGSLRAALGE
jgi:N-acetylmuramic acid 6-phosphate etherase/N-acetylglucosamine-6-phosphate deacetylase